MYPVSSLFKSKIQENIRFFKISIEIQHSDGVLYLSDTDIVSGSLLFNEASQSGEDFSIGGTVASDIEFSILNKEEYEDIKFVGATVIVHVGLELIQGLNYTYEDLKQFTYGELKQFIYGQIRQDIYEYVPLGRFNVDEVDRQRNSIKIKAIDNMIEFDKPYNLSELGYPATLFQIYVDACTTCDVMPAMTTFPNMNYIVQEKPEGDYTFRDIIGYIAELAGCFARVNRTGGLEFVWYTDSGVTITANNRFNLKVSDNSVQIKGIMATVDDTTYIAGTDEYVVDLSENPLLQGDYGTVLPNIFDNVKDTVFIPYESSWQGNPAMQAGDIITQVDRDGNIISTLVTSSTYKYRGASTLKAEGLSELVQGYQGSTNKKIAEVKKLTKKLEKETTNRLTDLEQTQLQATQLIASMLGGYAIQGSDAFYVADSPDLSQAQKVWKWGIGGFGYSENGVDGPYTTAVTADGSIVAMLVAAGIVTADMVQTGLLQSQDGNTWINLDDGTFNFKDVLKWVNNELIITSPSIPNVDNVVLQNALYNGVKITSDKGISVLDDLGKLRVQLGNYIQGKYGLLIKDSTGNKTILDEDGILQTWQEGRADNVASGKPLVLNIYLPNTTRSINQALLRFKRQPFRAYSTAASSGGGSTRTSSGSGSHRHRVFDYIGTVSETNWNNYGAYEFRMGTGTGGSGANFFIKSPGGSSELYTKEAAGYHDHTVNIPSHVHGITYGIYEGGLPTNITIKINGIDKTSALGGDTGFNLDQSSLNITTHLTIGQWNTIELSSSTLGRIDATVFIQALMGV